MRKFSLFLSLALLLACQSTLAESRVPLLATEKPLHLFMVSGILRAGGEGIVVKQVQNVQAASTKEEAMGTFALKALEQFPGYSLFEIIATPLPSAIHACGQSV